MIENPFSESPTVARKHHEDVWVNNNGLDDLLDEGRGWVFDGSMAHATSGSVFEDVIQKYVEPVAEEVLALVDSLAKDDFDDSWEQLIESMVVPLSLEDYWNAFWADQAPYFVPAFMTGEAEEIESVTDWGAPIDATGLVYGHTPVDRQRIIERKVKPSGSILTRVKHQKEILSLVEKNERKISLKVVTFNTGSMYAKSYQQWAKWEFVTPDPRSEQVAVRHHSVTRWTGNHRPMLFADKILAQAREARQADLEGLQNFFADSASSYVDGLPDGPFANAIWPKSLASKQ